MPGWNVDQEIANLSAANRLEVLDDRIDMPALNERRGRLHNHPSLAHELAEASQCPFRVNLFEESGSSQQVFEVVGVLHL